MSASGSSSYNDTRDLIISISSTGDTLETDIRGGNEFGIDTVLVLSGNTARENYQLSIDASGVISDFLCDSIAT